MPPLLWLDFDLLENKEQHGSDRRKKLDGRGGSGAHVTVKAKGEKAREDQLYQHPSESC